MASAWGSSWGSAWGSSWGGVTPAATVQPSGGIVSRRGKNQHYLLHPLKREDEERIQEALEAVAVVEMQASVAAERERAQRLEDAILAARTVAEFRALGERIQWAEQLARELRRQEDDEMAAVLLLLH